MTIWGRKRVDLALKAKLIVAMNRRDSNDCNQLGNLPRPEVLQNQPINREPSLR